jgi:hypothetical protein
MKPARRFAFGHDHALSRTAQHQAQNGDAITVPLADCTAPVASPWGRPTLPLVDPALAAPATPALPFHAPATPAPREREIAPAPPPVAPVAPPPVAVIAPPPATPLAASQKRLGLYIAMAAVVLLALYTEALVVFVVPRRAVDALPGASVTAPMVAPASSAPPPPEVPPEASASAPTPSVTASAPAPQASAPRPPATPWHPTPARVPRPPAPARTARPGSDVVNPWSYD